jgi:plastocyanin
MRVFTARFLLGSLAIATVCVIASPAEAGPLRRLFGGRGAGASTAACCPDVGYGYGAGYGQAAAYPATGYGYAATPCCDAAPLAYGSAGYGSMAFGRRGFRSASYSQPAQVYGSASYYQPGQVYGVGGYYQPGQVYGAGGYHQPGHLIPAGGVPMPLPGTGASGTTDATPANAEKAKITDDAFDPPTLTIKPGTAVRWTNDGQKPHTVTSVKGDWDSGDIPAGKDFTATFTKPGTFEYYCRHHKNMKGTIIVK